MAGMPLQALAPHADLAAHEFMSELEKNGFQFVLQHVEHIWRGIRSPMSGIAVASFAGFLQCNLRYPGIEPDKDRADDAERGRSRVQEVAVALHERFGGVVESRCDKQQRPSAVAFTTRECGVRWDCSTHDAYRPTFRRRARPQTKS
jgi:hypothetical protein